MVNQPATDDGRLAWTVIRSCRWQLRVGVKGAYALDMGAVMAMAEGMDARSPLLAEVLPAVEGILVAAARGAPRDGEEG